MFLSLFSNTVIPKKDYYTISSGYKCTAVLVKSELFQRLC